MRRMLIATFVAASLVVPIGGASAAEVIETVLVTLGVSATGDGEVVRLSETGPDTGIFTGHIQTGPGPAANGNGVLSVDVSSRIDGTYVDVVDGTLVLQ